ncbi:MAG: hypothetical protein ACREAK_01595 [Nitrosarchaeum sp.]
MLSKDKSIIIIAIVIGVVALTVMMLFIRKGNVRTAPISWQEKIKQTVAFEDIDGIVHRKEFLEWTENQIRIL